MKTFSSCSLGNARSFLQHRNSMWVRGSFPTSSADAKVTRRRWSPHTSRAGVGGCRSKVNEKACDEQYPSSSSGTENRIAAVDQKKITYIPPFIGKFLTTAAVGAFCIALAVTSAGSALAANSGGRMGGSAFSSGGSYSASSSGSNSFSGSLGGGGYRSNFPAGPGIVSMSTGAFGFYSGPPVYSGYGGGGGGLSSVLLVGLFAFLAYQFFAGPKGEDMEGGGVTVTKLQVGLLGSARQIQRDLDSIAERADTNSPAGLHLILQETLVALLRNPDFCVYGNASTSRRRDVRSGESRFNEMSMEERSKFKEETLINVGGRRKSGRYGGSSSGQQAMNELIVVTLIVAAEGGFKLPKVTTLDELRKALSILGGISKSQTLAVEVLWTPQDEGDFYSKDELLHDYPTLNNL